MSGNPTPATATLSQDQMDQLAPAVAKQVFEQFRSAPDDVRGLFAPKGVIAENKPLSLEERLLRFSKFIGVMGGLGKDMTIGHVRARMGMVPEFADMAKGLQESVFAAGGAMLVPELSSDVIEFLRPQAILLAMGARVEQFKGEMIIRKRTGGVTMYWVEEGKEGTKSAPASGQIKLQPHKGIVLTDVSNDLLRNPAAGDLGLAEDIVAEVAAKFDKAGIQGSGVEAQPLGVIGQLLAAQDFAKAGVTAANYIADIDKAVRIVKESELPIESNKPGWLMTPAKEADLLGLTHANGSWVFRDEMLMRGTLRGYPYKVTTNMDGTRLLFGLWSQLYYGIDTGLVISTHPDTRATYDETLVRGVIRGDFKVRQPKAFAAIKGY